MDQGLTTEVQTELGREIADWVMAVLGDRKGFNGWWDGIDEDVQEEIMDSLAEAAAGAIRHHAQSK
ncbi:MAG TPA: hypothetical protein VGU45_12535 [Microvirga sp.]|nr:hypothetical protein [Microvirga sp.]